MSKKSSADLIVDFIISKLVASCPNAQELDPFRVAPESSAPRSVADVWNQVLDFQRLGLGTESEATYLVDAVRAELSAVYPAINPQVSQNPKTISDLYGDADREAYFGLHPALDVHAIAEAVQRKIRTANLVDMQ